MRVSAVARVARVVVVSGAIDEACCLGIVDVVLLVWISIFYFLSHFDFDFPSREIETTYSVKLNNSKESRYSPNSPKSTKPTKATQWSDFMADFQ